MKFRPVVPWLTVALVTSIAGCGGGGGGSSAPRITFTPTPSPSPSTCTTTSNRLAGMRRAPRASGGLVPNRLYVTYKAGVRSVASVDKSASVVQTVDLSSGGSTRRVITLAPGVDADTFASTIRRDASVVSVDRVHYRSLMSDGVANDPLLNNDDQWYLYKTNVDPGAWALSHGSSSVTVAVIDTGVDETNTDFNFAFKEQVLGGVRTTGNGSVQDTNGHGTNTAGLATALTNNGYGFAGTGWSTALLAFKIFPNATTCSDQQTADSGDEALAINDAVSHGASVISLSLGSAQRFGADPAEENAIEAAISAGVVVVAAAGNEFGDGTADGNQPDFPAAYPGVIAVGASAVGNHTANSYSSITSENVATYSNSGPTLVAPGGDAGNDTTGTDRLIWIEGYSTTTATYPPDQCSNSGGVCRVLFNGTSQATPQVAGAVALMEAYHGGARSLTPTTVTSILTSTTDNIGATSTRMGAGRLNVGKAVAAAHP
ncbi:MAG TPA: S8 family serine peptidase [Candidatus Elarobacter sp.]|jgi:thermitase|nr:S8 family serine peptidase [Candidatus Elarobacter sp.]